jgi:hypothetical protein
MSDNEDVEPVVINVYTSFFKRDLQIYALGDIRFQKPKSLKAVGYTLAFMFLWSGPMFALIGPARVISNIVWAFITFGPPVIMGMIASKPVFHNKPLIKDLISIFRYFNHPKMYTDFQSYDAPDYADPSFTMWIADWDCYGQEEEDLDEPDGGYKTVVRKRRKDAIHKVGRRGKK